MPAILLLAPPSFWTMRRLWNWFSDKIREIGMFATFSPEIMEAMWVWLEKKSENQSISKKAKFALRKSQKCTHGQDTCLVVGHMQWWPHQVPNRKIGVKMFHSASRVTFVRPKAWGPFTYYLITFCAQYFHQFFQHFFFFLSKKFKTAEWKSRQNVMLKNKLFCFGKNNQFLWKIW